MQDRKTVALDDLFPDDKQTATGGATDDAPKRRGRKPAGAGSSQVDKATIDEILQLASAGLKLSGNKDLALDDDEHKQMVDAWYRVAKEYPAFGKYVVKGRTASVWGNLILVNMIVVGKRIDLVSKKLELARLEAQARKAQEQRARPTAVAQTGTARPAMRQEWERQDNTGAEASIS